ncbi:unnamed protein product [Danaus chrysippus]|uniref:(African queen) hypothetical protein n=1 Tax=Danaus chrysippus TaxID=151541 RepID=A0A8J2QR73_9NEOP|nr:unnamed protein product [Danaus chrysippus]
MIQRGAHGQGWLPSARVALTARGTPEQRPGLRDYHHTNRLMTPIQHADYRYVLYEHEKFDRAGTWSDWFLRAGSLWWTPGQILH